MSLEPYLEDACLTLSLVGWGYLAGSMLSQLTSISLFLPAALFASYLLRLKL